MANKVTRRYASLDTFGADVDLKTGDAHVLSITVVAAGGAKAAHFINADGDKVFAVSAPTGEARTYSPAEPVRVFGLTYDDSESSTASGDYVIVHFS